MWKLFVLVLLLPLHFGAAHAAPAAATDYLRKNAQEMILDRPVVEFDRAFERTQLILLGEVHGIQHGQRIDLALLKHFHGTSGVRTYVGEFDFAQAESLNRYLQSGDESSLAAVFDGWRKRGLQWANQDLAEKIRQIRAWNLTLPRSRRVSFYGADELQDIELACRLLAENLPTRLNRQAAKDFAATVKDPMRCRIPKALAETARIANQDIAARRELTRGRDRIVGPALASLATDDAIAEREERIAANVERLLSSLPHNTAAYGLWGLAHIIQARVNGSAPMAMQIEMAGRPGRVGSILMLNLDAEMMTPMANADGSISYTNLAYTVDSEDAALVNGIEDVKRASGAAVTLFRLDAPGSPFLRGDPLTRVGGRFGRMQPFTVDPSSAGPRGHVQYLILTRGSKATMPWPASRP